MYPAQIISSPFLRMRSVIFGEWLSSKTQNIVPTQQLQSMLDDPSKGSNATIYFLESSTKIASSFSSEVKMTLSF